MGRGVVWRKVDARRGCSPAQSGSLSAPGCGGPYRAFPTQRQRNEGLRDTQRIGYRLLRLTLALPASQLRQFIVGVEGCVHEGKM